MTNSTREIHFEPELIRRKGVPPKVGSLNDPTPNPEEYHEGKAIYVNEPGFYTIVLGSKKAECKAFKRWVTHEVLPQIRRTVQYHERDAQAVVVSPDGPAADQLARLLTTVETRLTAQDEILARVQERLDRSARRHTTRPSRPGRSQDDLFPWPSSSTRSSGSTPRWPTCGGASRLRSALSCIERAVLQRFGLASHGAS